MNKGLTLALGAVVAAVTSQAAITWGPWAETSTTLSGSANWSGSPDPETASTSSPGGNWWVSLTFSSTLKSYSVVLDGQHLVAPHVDDNAPGDIIELGVLFTKSTGSGTADGSIIHNRGAKAGHTDTWHFDAKSNSIVDVSFTAVHSVPEPSTYAMIAGLGLVGFAAFRRFKA